LTFDGSLPAVEVVKETGRILNETGMGSQNESEQNKVPERKTLALTFA
jgi:hypothetical protein